MLGDGAETLNITGMDSPGRTAMRRGPSRRSIWDFECETNLVHNGPPCCASKSLCS